MNILVVDDEYYIVKNIIDHTNWEALGIQKQFSAYSAQQARKVLEGPDPIDLLLTDIEMPRETGLELVAWMQENNLHPVVIFLTGHQRFDYAQAAINLHIYSYLLKPVNMEELERTLASAIKEVQRLRSISTQAPPEPEYPSDSTDLITTIQTFIKENLSSPDLNRTIIADYVHLNADYVSHLYREKTGNSLSNYINEVRMNTAMKMLSVSNYSLQQISDKTGFSNVSYFHRQFKKYTDLTPQQYRNQTAKT